MEAITIEDYTPLWALEFQELKKVLDCALGAFSVEVLHVGSTAVFGLPAKPILDLDVVIPTLSSFFPVKEVLERLGYLHQGCQGIPGREAFKRRDIYTPETKERRIFMAQHLYVCVKGTRELLRHIAFCTYLRTEPTVCFAYGQLKKELAHSFGEDREGYTKAKTAFIEQCLLDAERKNG